MYRISAIINTEEYYEKYSSFLSDVFTSSKLYTTGYLSWQYGQNPVGKAMGSDAWEGNELVAHYAALPISVVYNNQVVKGLLSLNVATHPNHQGKGLFTKLAANTFELAKANGYEFVMAVSNASSTPGFVKKFDFTLLTQLLVFIGVGSITPNRQQASFKIDRNPEFLKWRLARPAVSYTKHSNKGKDAVYTATHLLMVQAQLTNYEADIYNQLDNSSPLHATLWIGYNNKIQKNGFFVPLPEKLKPSPLNLIIKSISTTFEAPQLHQFDLGLIDFDAF